MIAAWYEGGKEDPNLALLRFGEPHLVANLPGMEDGLDGGRRHRVGAGGSGGQVEKIAALSPGECG